MTKSLNAPLGGEFGTSLKERNHCNFTGATGLQKSNCADLMSVAMSRLRLEEADKVLSQ